LGQTGLAVAPLMLGGNVFGWSADARTSFAILDAFCDAGFNAIDTADVYSTWVPGHRGGESEEIIGAWLAASGARDRVMLATKIGALPASADGQEWNSDLSAGHIVRAVEASLRRLHTDRIDLCQVHLDDGSTPVEETLEAFARLMDAGKVRAIGASHFTRARLVEALDTAARRPSLPAYATYQFRYNLLDREEGETQFLPLCRERTVSALCYSALAKGYLTGRYRGEDAVVAGQWPAALRRYAETDRGEILTVLTEVASQCGTSLAAAALAWVVSKPGVAAAIVAVNSPAELAQACAATSCRLSADQIAVLDAVGTSSINL